MRKPLLFVVSVAALAVSPLVACSAKKPNPPVTPTVDAAPEAGPEGGPLVMGTADGGLPEAGPIIPIAIGDAGPAVTPNTAEMMDSAIDLAIKAAAAKDAPNMLPEGQPGRQTMAENDHFNMIVTLAPNRCYTIIGFSPLGQVQALDIKLMAPPLFNVPAGQSGANDKNAPVIGKGKQALCPILPLPVAYKIDVHAKKGAGRMAVQVFARNK